MYLCNAHVFVSVVLKDRRWLTSALWTARPWHVASPPICWTRLLRPLKSQNTTDIRHQTGGRRQLKPQTPPVRSMDIISETLPIYTAPVGSPRLTDNMDLHTFDSAEYSDGILWVYIWTKNVIWSWRKRIIKLKLLLEQHWKFRKTYCASQSIGRLDFNPALSFMTSCRRRGDFQQGFTIRSNSKAFCWLVSFVILSEIISVSVATVRQIQTQNRIQYVCSFTSETVQFFNSLINITSNQL